MELPIACSLSAEELRRQGRRFEVVARSATAVARDRTAVSIAFAETVDRATLAELIAVERECCPFFALRYAEDERRLTVSVEDDAHAPALGAIAERLTSRAN